MFIAFLSRSPVVSRRSEDFLTSVPAGLDYAKVRYGGRYQESDVEDIKALPHIFAMFLALVPFFLVRYQVNLTL